MMAGILCFDFTNLEELKEAVAQRAQALGPDRWIRGAGWIENQFDEWRMPTRWDLDEAAPYNPVMLNRLFGMSVVNSRALELAGISAATEPTFGRIDHDPETGEPTGILRDGAQELVHRVIPQEGPDERAEAIARAAEEYIRYGITSVVDPGVSPLTMRAYQKARRLGRLPIRVNMMPVWHGLWASRAQLDLNEKLDQLGIVNNFGDEWLSIGPLKMAIDGGLGSMTAWMHDPFLDGTYSQAELRLDIERLEEYFERGHSAGWSIGIHCCGDRAQDVAVETLARVMRRHPNNEVRHNIIHGYFPSPTSLDLMTEHKIAVSVQPGFIWVEGDLYFRAVAEDRLENFKPLRTYLDKGIIVAANSDMTSAHYNPFWGMHSAATRQTSRGRVLGTSEQLSVEELLPLFTINGAYLSFEEDLKGSIEVGKVADMAVLSANPLEIEAAELRNLAAELTVIGGAIVHDGRS
jgi:hypothetical protein